MDFSDGQPNLSAEAAAAGNLDQFDFSTLNTVTADSVPTAASGR
jgi:hypothetical protein